MGIPGRAARRAGVPRRWRRGAGTLAGRKGGGGDRKSPSLQEKGARTVEGRPHRPPKGGDRANILQGRGAKALEESVPEVAPASS